MWSLVLVSIIDRAGVPVALVGGLVALQDDGRGAQGLFAMACCVAGWCGDLACFCIGRYALRPSGRGLLVSGPASLGARLKRVAQFIDPAPRTWLMCGRVFHAINQFVPMAAAVRNRSWREVAWTCAAGNVMWFGLWAALTFAYQDSVRELGRPARWATGILGLAVAWWSLRLAWRRVAPTAAPRF